jgi:hypothetical protein
VQYCLAQKYDLVDSSEGLTATNSRNRSFTIK